MEENNVQQSTQQEENKEVKSSNIDYNKIEEMVNKGIQQKENGILKSYFSQQGLSEDEMKVAIETYKTNKANKQKEEAAKNPDVVALQNELETLKSAAQKERLNNQIQLKAFDLGLNKKAINAMLKIEDFSDVIVDGKIDDSKLETKMSAFLDEYDVFKPQATVQGKPGVGVGAKQVDKDEQAQQDAQLRKYFGLK